MPESVHIKRHHSSVPFGFKLQGGQDFSIPLSILEVTPNSIAEQVGLRPGDAILKINNVETSWMDHNRGKQEIVCAGDDFWLEVQRNAVNNSYQPAARPLSALLPTMGKPYNKKAQHILPVPQPIKTDLTVDKGPSINIGTSHNRAPMPFNRNVGTSVVYQAQKPTNWTPGDYTRLNEPSPSSSYNDNAMNQQFYPPQQQNHHNQQQPQYNQPPQQQFYPNYNNGGGNSPMSGIPNGVNNNPMKASLMAEIRNQTKVNTSHTELIKKGIQQPATAPSYQPQNNNFGSFQAQPLRSSAQPRTSGSSSMRMLNRDLQNVEGTNQQASSIFDLKNGNPTGATVPRGFRSVMAPVELPPDQRHAPMRKEYQVQHNKANWIEPRMN